MAVPSKKTRRVLWDMLVIVAGSCVFAVSVNVFFEPFHIVPGGVTGAAMIVSKYAPALPIGTWALIINIPLFLLAWKFLGHRFLLMTFLGTVASSLAINMLVFIPVPRDLDPLLAGLTGGVLSGVGLGLVFTRGATTGGSDIAARLLKAAFPHVQIGRLILLIDGLVVAASAFAYGSLQAALYAAVSLYVSSLTVDALVYGGHTARVAYIISEQTQDVVAALSVGLGRGATLLHGEGSYARTPRQVILCAVKRQQIAILKQLVKAVDPAAFIILTEASEVLGEGFADYDKNAV